MFHFNRAKFLIQVLSLCQGCVYTKTYSNALGSLTWCKGIDNETSDIFQKIILKLLSYNSLQSGLNITEDFPIQQVLFHLSNYLYVNCKLEFL